MTTTGELRFDDVGAVLLAPLSDPAPAHAAPAATSVRGVNAPECRSTRAAMHDYLNRRLQPRRQRRFEAHMDGCAACIRAFIDIREVSWKRQAVGQPPRGARRSAAGTVGDIPPAVRRARPHASRASHLDET